MNLQDCLLMLPSGHLRKLAERYGLPFLGESPEDLVSHIVDFLLDPDNLAGVLASMEPIERLALDLVVLTTEDGLHRIRCHRHLRTFAGLGHDAARTQYVRLLRMGLVFQGRRGWEELYFVPEDLKSVLASWSLSTLVWSCTVEDDMIKTSQVPPDLLVRQAHWFLAYCYRHPPRITQQNRIYKRDQEQIFAAMGWPMPDTGTPFFAPDQHHLEPLHFLLAYFEGAGVVDASGKVLEVTDRLQSWLALSDSEKRADVLKYLLENYPPAPAMPLIVTALAIEAEVWVDWRRFLESLTARLLTPEERMSFAALLEGGVNEIWQTELPLFAALGFLEMGTLESATDEDPRLAVRWVGGDPLQGFESAHEFYLQPTFDVLMPLTADYELIWGLELIADLQKIDRMCIYHLSRASVYRALETGVEADEVLVFLEEGSRTPLPQNVRYTLQDWVGRYGVVRFTEGIVVECSDDETAQALRAITLPSRRPLVSLGPHHFLIDRSDHSALVNRLRELGQLPDTTIHSLNGKADGPLVSLRPQPLTNGGASAAKQDRRSKRVPPRFWNYRWHRPDFAEEFTFSSHQPVSIDPRGVTADGDGEDGPGAARF